MTELQLTTSGESHGPALVGILSGLPAGLPVDRDHVDAQLRRRQLGHGRSPRQRIERDEVRVLGGLRHGRTLGSPLAMLVENRDHASWDAVMDPWPTTDRQGNWRDDPIHVVRPGHADLGGIARGGFDTDGLRPVLERASARETAIRVAAGAVAQQLLGALGVRIRAHVRGVGPIESDEPAPEEHDERWATLDQSPVRTLDGRLQDAMVAEIDEARRERDTVGGSIEILTWGLPPGIGGYATSVERLDGRLAGAVVAVHAIKACWIGDAMECAGARGSQFHDELQPAGTAGGDHGMGVTRRSNRAGGIEGGMTTGAPVVIRALMKPLPTLMRPLDSVDVATGEPATAHAERSDTCAIAAAAVVLECAVALEIARVVRAQFGGAALADVTAAFGAYASRVRYPQREAVKLA